MLPLEQIDRIERELEEFRASGLLLFDGRDHGNYSNYESDRVTAMLRRCDPTGLAEALLLREKIVATLKHSRVVLERVLLEDGYLAKIATGARLLRELDQFAMEARCNLRDYLAGALESLGGGLGTPEDREVACCLRDAIYCMESGLRLRWLVCEAADMPAHVPLSPRAGAYGSLTEFTDALRTTLPFGAHLAQVGSSTVIGIKQPGRVAFLSSLSVDIHTGGMQQERMSISQLAEPFDLDKPVLRYPDWADSWVRARENGAVATPDSAGLPLNLLSRDRVIWLAMVVELAGQQMARTMPGDAVLCEAVVRALPGADTKNLPVRLAANWMAEELTLEGMVATLGLTEWELRFLAPALEGMSPAHFLPPGPGDVALDLDSRTHRPWPAGGGNFSDNQKVIDGSVRLTGVSDAWVGSKEEIDAARRAIFGKNLVSWLIGWGNREFAARWKECEPWFKKRLAANAGRALELPFVTLEEYNHLSPIKARVHLYTQSPRHVTYKPLCFIAKKGEMHRLAVFAPASSAEIARMLGLKSESQLPEFLRGWQRDLGWRTVSPSAQPRPYYSTCGWCFAKTPVYRGAPDCRIVATIALGVGESLRLQARIDERAGEPS